MYMLLFITTAILFFVKNCLGAFRKIAKSDY